MPNCPRCSVELNRRIDEHGLTFICPKCQGQAIGVGVLHKADIDDDWLKSLWERARLLKGNKACPHCARPMSAVSNPVGMKIIELDVCTYCHAVWFDRNEPNDLPHKPPPSPPSAPMSEKSRLALMDVALETQRETYDLQHVAPPNFWQKIMAIFGLPIEENNFKIISFPYMTWGISLGCIMIYLTFYGRLDWAASAYGFIPAHALRLAGITIFASFFLHGGFLHLLGNLYFLIVFGDNVEIKLGRIKFLLLLFGSHLAGLASHYLFYMKDSTPLIGASAGIMGLVAFYAVAFPKAKITQLLIIYFRPYWLKVPVQIYLLIFVLFQFIWLIQSSIMLRSPGIAFLAHFGGMAAGICIGIWFRLGEKEKLQSTLNQDY